MRRDGRDQRHRRPRTRTNTKNTGRSHAKPAHLRPVEATIPNINNRSTPINDDKHNNEGDCCGQMHAETCDTGDDEEETQRQQKRRLLCAHYSWLAPTGFGPMAAGDNTICSDGQSSLVGVILSASSYIIPRELAMVIIEYTRDTHLIFIGVHDMMVASPNIGCDVFVYSCHQPSQPTTTTTSASASGTGSGGSNDGNGRWRVLPRLPSPRYGAWAAISSNGTIIVGDGRTYPSDTPSSYLTLNISGTGTNPYEWQPMRTSIDDDHQIYYPNCSTLATSSSFDGSVYVSTSITPKIPPMNPFTRPIITPYHRQWDGHQWTRLAGAPAAIDKLIGSGNYSICSADDGYLYFIGGNHECVRYHPSTCEWSVIPAMNYTRNSPRVVCVPGGILAIGGEAYMGVTARVVTCERYCYQRNQWHVIANGNIPIPGLTAFTAVSYGHNHNTVMVVGGSDEFSIERPSHVYQLTIQRFDILGRGNAVVVPITPLPSIIPSSTSSSTLPSSSSASSSVWCALERAPFHCHDAAVVVIS